MGPQGGAESDAGACRVGTKLNKAPRAGGRPRRNPSPRMTDCEGLRVSRTRLDATLTHAGAGRVYDQGSRGAGSHGEGGSSYQKDDEIERISSLL